MKKIVSLLLACALLLPALSMTVDAKKEKKPVLTPQEQVILEAQEAYLAAKATAGVDSFHGYCGMMVSHLLRVLKINKYRVSLDGRDHYDYYAARKKTTRGYPITAYSAYDYDLKGALDALTVGGKRDARNVMVGFQWTNTEAGGRWGHVLLINAIMDGTVYFVESFDCFIGGRLYPEGTTIQCSVEEFAAYFDRWTLFEGLIHFGSGTYEEACFMRETDVYVQARFAATLRSQPCLVGENDCQLLRTVAAGERLHATAIYRGDRGLYYRVETLRGYGYIPAGSVMLLALGQADLQVTRLQLPTVMEAGQSPTVSGTVTAQRGAVSAVEIRVLNESGNRVARSRVVAQGQAAELTQLTAALELHALPKGTYIIELYADGDCYTAQDGEMVLQYQQVRLARQILQVESAGNGSKLNHLPQLPQETPPEGWFQSGGKWYYGENGVLKTGWVDHMGVRYYLGADGAAVSGWQTVGNQLRCFTAQGAMITNCQAVYGKTLYRLDGNGIAWVMGEIQ